MFSMSKDPGICTSCDVTGFWAIGSGQQQALSSIFFSFKDLDTRPIEPSLEGLIYDLCAAKFMAERADGVGEATDLVIQRFGQGPHFYSDDSINAIRKIWEEEGRPRQPENIKDRIAKLPLIPISNW
jgi:hypothetical protein